MFSRADQSRFRRAEKVVGDVKSAKAERGLYGHARTFVRWVSEHGSEEPCFTNVGRWRTNDAAEKKAPVYIPWLVIDIDNIDLAQAYEDALRTVNRLLALGYDAERIVCSFSGGKGFHVQVDSTQMGLVPFARQETARVFLRAYTRDVCLDDYWDPAVCSPRSLIRVTGSTHSRTGYRKRSFLSNEFRRRGLHGVMKGLKSDYRGFRWPEGGDILPGPREHLRDVFEAAERQYRARSKRGMNRKESSGSKGGVLNRIKRGIQEGEEFGPKNFHVGRENAAFIIGCKLLAQHPNNQRVAREKLMKWNGLNDPPLPRTRVKAQWRGARRKMSDKLGIRHA